MGAEEQRKHRLAASFRFAFQGIAAAAAGERNFQIHLGISTVVVFFGLWFSITVFEWIAVLLAIGGMLGLELMNTALERTVDMYTKEFHPLAKQAKDIAAGAVLIYAIISIIIGALIFLPRIIVALGF